MDKEAVKKNFSKCARYYDRFSNVQDLCASRLISKIEKDSVRRILDIGCGTGNYTRLLKEKFPSAQITALDISKEMVDIAKRKLKDEEIEFIVADGETIDFKESFDFISSNATFQWFEDLKKALSRYKSRLRKGGFITFSTFGPLTFYELDSSLKEFFGRDISTTSYRFNEAAVIKRILRHLFKRFEVDEEIFKEDNGSLEVLLKKIKYTGTRGDGANPKNFWTPKIIDNLEKIYRKRFKKITATYQIFFCKGIK